MLWGQIEQPKEPGRLKRLNLAVGATTLPPLCTLEVHKEWAGAGTAWPGWARTRYHHHGKHMILPPPLPLVRSWTPGKRHLYSCSPGLLPSATSLSRVQRYSPHKHKTFNKTTVSLSSKWQTRSSLSGHWDLLRGQSKCPYSSHGEKYAFV